jgi:hypothetical protein
MIQRDLKGIPIHGPAVFHEVATIARFSVIFGPLRSRNSAETLDAAAGELADSPVLIHRRRRTGRCSGAAA